VKRFRGGLVFEAHRLLYHSAFKAQGPSRTCNESKEEEEQEEQTNKKNKEEEQAEQTANKKKRTCSCTGSSLMPGMPPKGGSRLANAPRV